MKKNLDEIISRFTELITYNGNGLCLDSNLSLDQLRSAATIFEFNIKNIS